MGTLKIVSCVSQSEELYDFICSEIGFEDDKKELREAIKKFGDARALEAIGNSVQL